MPFSSLGLSPALTLAVTAKGYTSPTPVQSQTIPAALAGSDLLVCAQTGSGKTAAFGIPLLQKLEQTTLYSPRQLLVLVLVPTRELAAQVAESLRSIGQHLKQSIKISAVYGGVSINPQLMALRSGTDVMVATPGRLLDLIDHNALNLRSVHTLVLDEADRLLDLGFSAEIDRILELLPAQRQSLFLSATFPNKVNALAQRLLNSPVRIDLKPSAEVAQEIQQTAYAVDSGRRTQLLRHLIQEKAWTRVLVFVATKHATEIVADKLRKAGIQAEPFHGLLSQGKRTQVLLDFKASRIAVVVATDVAARGIDIARLPVVVNYDLPRSAVDYTHRIGRTGRAGESGLAVSFVDAASAPHFKLIQSRHALSIALESEPGFEPTDTAAPPPGTGGIKGKRPSKKDKLRAALK